MIVYEFLTWAALAATTAYSLLNIYSSVRDSFSTAGRCKNEMVQEMKLLSSKVRQYYEAFTPSWTLGDHNEARMAGLNVLFGFAFLLVVLSRGTVGVSVFEASTLPLLPPFLLYLILPMYVVDRMNHHTASRAAVKDEAGSVEFAKRGGSLLWKMTTIMMIASIGTVCFEAFLVENFSSAVAVEWPFYAEAVGMTVAVIVPGFAILRHARTALEISTSSTYFSRAGHQVLLEITSRVAKTTFLTYSGSLISTGDSIYLKKSDGFLQQVPWKGMHSIATRE